MCVSFHCAFTFIPRLCWFSVKVNFRASQKDSLLHEILFDQNAWSTFRTGSSQHGRRSSWAYPWSATAIWFHDFSGNNVSAYWALRLFVRLCIVCSSIVDLFNWTLSLVYQESEHHLPHIHKNNNSSFRIDSDQIPHPVECSSNY